jgi:hypothetical protein
MAMIAALCLGMTHLAIHMPALALKHMKYFIKTAHGISDAYYRVTQDHLLYITSRQWGISFHLALNCGLSPCSTHCPGTTCNVICWLIHGVIFLRHTMLILLLMTQIQ